MKTTQRATPRDSGHVTLDHVTVNGRTVTPGVHVTITGIRGRCLVAKLTRDPAGRHLVDVYTSRGTYRTRHVDDIRHVHRARGLVTS